MLRSVITTLGSVVILAASIAAGHADGVPNAPGPLADDTQQDEALVQPVADPCAPRWQCGPSGCGYRAVCATPQAAYVPAYYYARPRVYSYGYSYAPRYYAPRSYRYSYGYAPGPSRSWGHHHHNGGHRNHGQPERRNWR